MYDESYDATGDNASEPETAHYYGPCSFTTTPDGDAMIYDDHTESAWIQSSVSVSLSERV